VAWQGLDPNKEWYPAENFKYAAAAFENFHLEYPDAAGPPVRLSEWLKAATEDKDVKDYPDDNLAKYGPVGTRTKKKYPTRHR